MDSGVVTSHYWQNCQNFLFTNGIITIESRDSFKVSTNQINALDFEYIYIQLTVFQQGVKTQCEQYIELSLSVLQAIISPTMQVHIPEANAIIMVSLILAYHRFADHKSEQDKVSLCALGIYRISSFLHHRITEISSNFCHLHSGFPSLFHKIWILHNISRS